MRKGKNKESVDKINQVRKNKKKTQEKKKKKRECKKKKKRKKKKKKNTRYPPKRIRQEKNLSRNENRNKTTKGTATTSNT